MSLHRFKVIILGDPGVGKSSILTVLFGRGKDAVLEQQMTIGCSFDSVKLDLEDFLQDTQTKQAYLNLIQRTQKQIRLEIWDTSGQDRFRSVVEMYFRNVQGVVVVYDLSDPLTLEGARRWINRFEQSSGRRLRDTPAIFIANKVDKVNTSSEHFSQMVAQSQKLASEYNKPFYITSMLFEDHRVSEQHVITIFSKLAENMINKYVITRSSDLFKRHSKIIKLDNQREEQKVKQTAGQKKPCSC